MSSPCAQPAAALRAQTCIAPDRMAHLARDVSEHVRGGFPGTYIHFDGAAPGQLSFSVRTRFARATLVAFALDITRSPDGFTSLQSSVHHRVSGAGGALGLELYRRYARELASTLARFDPLSTALILDRGHTA
ncbi:hypothetical protein ACQI4L_19565 [Mycolicibacterium litorale]|uniref:hypothetical protein n=1 Tax=Mycolicibacterium litorale TaxID=758802 RepID=UPI003CF6CD5C